MATARVRRLERLYAGQSRFERLSERRKRLMTTGLDLFGTVGYAETSIGAICARSRVTARHFYELFKSRHDLLQAVADEIVEGLISAVADALDQTPDAGARRVRAGVGAFAHYLLDDPRRARILCVEVVGLSPELEQHRRAVLHRFADLVTREAGNPDLNLRALALVAGTYELIIEAVTSPLELTAERLVDELSHLYVAAFS